MQVTYPGLRRAQAVRGAMLHSHPNVCAQPPATVTLQPLHLTTTLVKFTALAACMNKELELKIRLTAAQRQVLAGAGMHPEAT